jgi:predicted DCC family thiol-disulfide oxidoreductase YuxK
VTGETVARPLGSLADPLTPLTVLYDDECPFCRWTANRLRRWDRQGLLRLRPLQHVADQPVLAELAAGLDLGRSIHVVDSAGRYAAGGDAFLAIVSVLPAGRSVADFVLTAPLWRGVVRVAYRVVGRVRSGLSDAGFDGPLIVERNRLFDPPPDPGQPSIDEALALADE